MSTHNRKRNFPLVRSFHLLIWNVLKIDWAQMMMVGGNVVWPEISMDLLVRALESGRAP
jgi:hypothetical protein